jgi:hypothetical protein
MSTVESSGWVRGVIALSMLGVCLLGSRTSFAHDPIYSSSDDWWYWEGFCYNHDEFLDATPGMADRGASPAPSGRPVPDLDCWLTQAYPEIAARLVWENPTSGGIPYPAWTDAQKDALRTSFAAAWNWFESGYAPEFGDAFPLGGGSGLPANLGAGTGTTILNELDAWAYYVDSVGQTLAAQMGHWFSWDLRLQIYIWNADLDLLLNSLQMFSFFDGWIVGSQAVAGYGMLFERHGAATPTSPREQVKFLQQNGLIQSTAEATAYAALDWGRDHLAHFNGQMDSPTETAVWQYDGAPPVSRVIEGTLSTQPSEQGYPPLHWTMGCHGTSGLYKSVLRSVNIPVQVRMVCSHSQMYFPIVGMYTYLSHSDDIYDARFRDANLGTPFDQQYPATTQVQSTATLVGWDSDYEQYYAPENASFEQSCSNIGIGAAWFVSGFAPTNTVMADYCHDYVNGLGHADGTVYRNNFVHPFFNLPASGFTVEYLEWAGLWTRLEEKRAALGCTPFPPR